MPIRAIAEKRPPQLARGTDAGGLRRVQRGPVGRLRLVCSLGVGSIDAVIAGAVRDRFRELGGRSGSSLGIPLR